MNLIETVEHDGKIIRIYQDESPESPRERGNLGTMLCNHRHWFEDGRAPYPVYSVETGEEVLPG